MKYADGPTVEVDTLVDAPIDRVWELVTDIELPARFSSEFVGATRGSTTGPRCRPASSGGTTTRHSANGRRPPPSRGTSAAQRSDGTCRIRRTRRRAGGSSSSRKPRASGCARAPESGRRRPGSPSRSLRCPTRRSGSSPAGSRSSSATCGRRSKESSSLPRRKGDRSSRGLGDAVRRAGRRLRPRGRTQGCRSVWIPEYWAFDVLTPLAFLARRTSTHPTRERIVQLGARTPAMLACRRCRSRLCPGGRFVLGDRYQRPASDEVGTASGSTVRSAVPANHRNHQGDHCRRTTRLPRRDLQRFRSPDGEGRSIRASCTTGARPRLRRFARTGEPALDGRAGRRVDRQLVLPGDRPCLPGADPTGRGRRGRELADLDLTVSVSVEFTDDVEEAGRRHAEGYAFTFGAIGSSHVGTSTTTRSARQGYGDDVRGSPATLARRRSGEPWV